MLQLAIRGHATRGREVIQLLEMLGGKSNSNMNGYNDDLYYFIAKDGLIYGSDIEYEELNCKYTIFTLEEFLEKFPYKVGDKVNSPCKGCIKTITSMWWDTYLNTITYKLDHRIYTNIDQLKVVNDLQPYKEEGVNLQELERKLDEALAKETPESLNKWLDEEMKKGSKLININPKLVGNECVHFPIPPNMKLEVKDGMCYLYRDCGEYKENKCLQELKEYLSHATREELDKTMEEIEIALAPFKVGDKVIVKCFEKMGEDEIICVFKTYDGDIKYKTKNHLDTHYFMGDSLMKVEKSNKEEKQKLFQAIKDNGYKWNPETKTLEKVVESRFHAGDWITDGISKYQILFIDDIQYWYSENGILGSIESVDKRYHHWTIQDAEDGDVLAFDDDTIVIFKDLYNKTTFHSYCHIEDGVFSISELDCPDWWDIKFKPATKEQRDFLFQKIKEAGYRWNAEIKTLEKLTIPHTPEKFYIRIGDIPSNEKSKIYKGDSAIGEEDGVSVYNCIKLNNIYHIVMPLPLKEGQGITYENLIQEIAQCRYEIEKPRNVYLVSGMEIGKGHDNEPLIKNVKILKDLTGQFNTQNDSTEETKTLEKLVEPKFKVGDIITKRDSIENSWVVSSVSSEYYGLQLPKGSEGIGTLPIIDQDKYELIPNKFDITTLKPFDNCKYSLDNGRTWKFAQYWYIMDNYKIDDIKIELWQD